MVEDTILDETKEELIATDKRIEELNALIKKADDLESLHEDERFINVILDGYLEAESQRIYGVLIDPTHRLKRDVMENLMDKLTSVRHIKQYFGTIMQNAAMAPEQLEEENAHRKSVTAAGSIIDVEVSED